MYNDIYIKLLFASSYLAFLTIAKKKVFFHAVFCKNKKLLEIEPKIIILKLIVLS